MHVEQLDLAGEEVLHNTLSSSLYSNQLEVFNTFRKEWTIYLSLHISS